MAIQTFQSKNGSGKALPRSCDVLVERFAIRICYLLTFFFFFFCVAFRVFPFVSPSFLPSFLPSLSLISFDVGEFDNVILAECVRTYTTPYVGSKRHPEYDKHLGPPLGRMVRDGFVFKRNFSHAKVAVNCETEASKIDWI